MKADQWMPLYVGDYLADTQHLSCAEHGAYLLLLMHQWRTGSIPRSASEQARIVRLSGQGWSRLAPSVLAFFSDAGGALQQPRLERVRAEQSEKIQRLTDRARAAGIASAAARKPNTSSTQVGLKPTYPEPEPEKNKNPSPSKNEGEGSSPAPVGAGDPPADPPDGKAAGKVPRKPPEVPDEVLWDMAAVWNEIAAAGHGLPSAADLTPRRRQQMRARCRERWTTDPVKQFRSYVRRICKSEFLTGGGPRGWKADFDWALQPRNVLAVAEGKYHDGENG
jgi:uncharacterized protein YdaU (DUF1376 family)